MTNFGGVDVVPWQGANFCFIYFSYFQGHQFHPDTQQNSSEFCLALLANVTLFSTLITQNLVLAIWGLCWYYLFFPDSDSYRGSYFQQGGGRRTTLADWTCHCWVPS